MSSGNEMVFGKRKHRTKREGSRGKNASSAGFGSANEEMKGAAKGCMLS